MLVRSVAHNGNAFVLAGECTCELNLCVLLIGFKAHGVSVDMQIMEPENFIKKRMITDERFMCMGACFVLNLFMSNLKIMLYYKFYVHTFLCNVFHG